MNHHPLSLADAHQIYLTQNRRALHWLIERMTPASPVINTKLNSISLNNYSDHDGVRGEKYTYGWIQGRGLEALVVHAKYLENHDRDLRNKLFDKASALYDFLYRLFDTTSVASFCYNEKMQPICSSEKNGSLLQQRQHDIATFSDLFVIKGLLAASCRFAPHNIKRHIADLEAVVSRIRRARFQLTENCHLDSATIASEPRDFAPRLIAIGAAALLHKLELQKHDSFSDEFIQYILDHHYNNECGLLATVPGGDFCNIGHTIEFAGFALEAHRTRIDNQLADTLADLICSAWNAGFVKNGLILTVRLPSLQPINTHCPWWSLPETIRAAALAYELTGNPELLTIWHQAHDVFYRLFWRYDPPLAYQMLDAEGPVDVTPGTTDLDPAYHTGLSLLSAMEMIERQK